MQTISMRTRPCTIILPPLPYLFISAELDVGRSALPPTWFKPRLLSIPNPRVNLVNNAGTGTVSELLDATPDQLHNDFGIMVFGALYVS